MLYFLLESFDGLSGTSITSLLNCLALFFTPPRENLRQLTARILALRLVVFARLSFVAVVSDSRAYGIKMLVVTVSLVGDMLAVSDAFFARLRCLVITYCWNLLRSISSAFFF